MSKRKINSMNKNKVLIPQEEHEEKVAETVDMITAEDLVEQAVYAVNAPGLLLRWSAGEKYA